MSALRHSDIDALHEAAALSRESLARCIQPEAAALNGLHAIAAIALGGEASPAEPQSAGSSTEVDSPPSGSGSESGASPPGGNSDYLEPDAPRPRKVVAGGEQAGEQQLNAQRRAAAAARAHRARSGP